jgi:hypothetical protein
VKGPLIIALLALYVFFVLARFGGHFVHILPVMAMAIYIYGLFTSKSAGISSESTMSPHVEQAALVTSETPLQPLGQNDQNRNLPESD